VTYPDGAALGAAGLESADLVLLDQLHGGVAPEELDSTTHQIQKILVGSFLKQSKKTMVLWDHDVLGGGLDVEGLEGVANDPGVEDLAIDVGGEKPGHVAHITLPYTSTSHKLITEN
jgi:hypothetical protein